MARHDLSPKEYLGLKTLRNGLKRVFKKYHIPGEFDDFFSTFQTGYLSGYHQTQSWDQFAIDYLRKCFGRDGKKMGLNAPVAMDSVSEPMDTRSKIPYEMFELNDIIGAFKNRERMILGLYLIHGLNQAEIAFLYDIHPATLNGILKNLLEVLKDRLELVN